MRGDSSRFRRRAIALAFGVLGVLACPVAPARADETPARPAVRVTEDELPRFPPRSPAEALATFQVVPGFRIEQVAAEPLVQAPVAMSFDEDGRLYVVEMIDYSEQGDEHLGRVRLLEDTDGDGRFDKASVFADRLSWPTAVLCYDGGVFVGAPPDIHYFKDTDGDGRADVNRTAFTGFHRTNVQGLLNSFQWGLDNRVHGATSTSGATVHRPGSAGPRPVPLNGRDFSFDPRTLELRPTSGGAQHGMSFDDWGRKFVCSNSDHIQIIMYEDRYVARNPFLAAPGARVSIAADGPQAEVYRISPVEPWRSVRTRLRAGGFVPGLVEGGGRAAGYFTGATGTTIYRGDAFPAGYRGQAFVGDVGSNIVHRKTLEPNGVGMIARRADDRREFVASSDTWFRPVQFANAPDGALYVLDMYREVIEHPASLPPEIKKYLDLTSGRDRGRIYRVVPDGYRQPKRTRLGSATTAELVAALESPNGWHRDTAARLIFERRDHAAVAPLKAFVTRSKVPVARVHALSALAGLGALDCATVLLALCDDRPEVREHALRASEAFLDASAELRTKVLAMNRDPDPRVRYQLAFTSGQIKSDARFPALAALAKRDGGDPWMRLAVLSSLPDGAGRVLTALLTDADFCRSPAARAIVPALAYQVGVQEKDEEAGSILERLEALPVRDRPLALVLVRGLHEGIAHRGTPSAAKLFAPGSRAEGFLRDLIASARQTAGDERRTLADRVEATRALSLGRFRDAKDVLAGLLGSRQPPELRSAAVTTLAGFRDDEVGDLLVGEWATYGPGLRAAAVETIFSRKPWVFALLRGVDSGAVAATDLDPARLKVLEHDPDEGVRRRVKALSSKLKPRRRGEVVMAYQQSLTIPGDRERGKVSFEKVCSACHTLEGKGYEVGPSLLAIKNRGAAAVLTNVLDPNAEVNPQYVNYVGTTRDGRSVSGMIASESATGVTFRRAEGKEDTVPRRDLEDLKSSGASIMPEGLEKELDVQAMADLLAYLMTVR